MSDIETTGETGTRQPGQARQVIDQAGQTLKQEVQSFASAAQDRVRAEAQKGAQTAGRTLGDFANAVRRAGEELADQDQNPASRLVKQAADGLESFSRNLADKEPGELLHAVRDFGRRNPAVFIGGAVLVGLAIGRFVRATEGGGEPAAPNLDERFAFADPAPPSQNLDAPIETGSTRAFSASGLLDDGVADTGPADPLAQRTGGV